MLRSKIVKTFFTFKVLKVFTIIGNSAFIVNLTGCPKSLLGIICSQKLNGLYGLDHHIV